MFNILQTSSIIKNYKKIFLFLLIFFFVISIGFLLGNHFFWEGIKGFFWNGSKTFNNYIKKKYYVQKSVNPLDLNSKNIELKEGNIPKDANLKGFWSPSFDWPVIAVHSILLQMKL